MVFALRLRHLLIAAGATTLISTVITASAAAVTLDDAKREVQSLEQRMMERAQAIQSRDPEKASAAERASRLALQSTRKTFLELGAGKTEDLEIIREYVSFLVKVGDFDLAAKELERAVKLQPGNVELHLMLARAYFFWGKPHEIDAERIIRKALDLNPDESEKAELHALLGRVYVTMGLFEFATENFQKALELDSEYPPAKIGVACTAIRDGKMKEGSDLIDTLQNLPPHFQAILDEMLNTCLLDFETAGKWFPDKPEEHLSYGKLLFRAGRLPASVGPIERSIKLDPENYVALNLLGGIQRSLGNNEQARDAYRRSLVINPDQPRTQEAIQQLLELEQQQQSQSPAPPAG